MPWGMTFAPEGFGDIGGQMLVGVTNYTVAGKAESGTIYAVDSAGKFKLFAKVPFWSGEGFLAHMNFSPDYFGSANGLGESLFISIAGKSGGGGMFGALLVLDENGTVFSELKVGSEFSKFDPTGVFFVDGDKVLISDGSDPILLADANEFGPASRVIPEPAGLLLLGSGLAGLLTLFHRKIFGNSGF